MRFHSRFIGNVMVLSLLLTLTVYSQDRQLTYKQAYEFAQPRLFQRIPSVRSWFDSVHYITEKSEGGRAYNLYKVNAVTGEEQLYLNLVEMQELLPQGFNINVYRDKLEDRLFLLEKDNDIYLLNADTKNLQQLTDDDRKENNASFSPDGKKVAYTKEHDLFVYDIDSGIEKRITFDGTDVVYNGLASWVYYEEILGRSSDYKAFWWSPDGEKIAFLRFDDSPVPEFTLYRAEGRHGSLEKMRYPKAGDPAPLVRLGIANAENGEVTWVTEETSEYVAWPFWTNNSEQLFYQRMNHDQNKLIIYSADAESGSSREVYVEEHPAWVEFFENIYFTGDNSGFFIISAKDGFNRLYMLNMEGKIEREVTPEAVVSSIDLIDEKNGQVYFTGYENNSTERHLYKIGVNGNNLVKLTEEPGTHSCSVSPEGKYFSDSFSNIETPGELRIKDGENGKLVRFIGSMKTENFDEYKLGKTELFRIPTEEGYELPARWILPPDFDESKKYAVIMNVYGGPGMASVRNSYSYSLDGSFLAQNGIIYMTMDHRGSGHFGKEVTAQMHRNLGKIEMEEYSAGVKWLESLPFVDSSKIAIAGGSYGGYVTCLALTYGSEFWDYGIADFSVTDWELYDNVYTERYMDTPEQNPTGYAWANTMNHIDNYKGGLLIRHGTMDDNVHMQNTIQFVGEMEMKNKDFQIMIYPGERHGFGYPKRFHAVRDETEFWFENLLGKKLDVNK